MILTTLIEKPLLDSSSNKRYVFIVDPPVIVTNDTLGRPFEELTSKRQCRHHARTRKYIYTLNEKKTKSRNTKQIRRERAGWIGFFSSSIDRRALLWVFGIVWN